MHTGVITGRHKTEKSIADLRCLSDFDQIYPNQYR